MCYAIPGKVERLEGTTVIVDYFGEKRRACNELIEIVPGDYIYAQGGFVVSKVSPEEAGSVLALWKELFFELQEVDLRLSRLNLERTHGDRRLLAILDNAVRGALLSRDDFIYLFGIRGADSLQLLFRTANFVRQKHFRNSCCVHGIIEISNYCGRGCHYCGIAAAHTALERYRMTPREIMEAARQAVEVYGFKSLLLQSGEDAGYSVDELADVVREIRERFSCLVFISFGEIGLDGLKRMYRAGARGLLMRFETSNPLLYQRFHPGQSFDERIAHLKKAYELGYLILTGALIGLPGQTAQDILNDIYLARELHAEMFSFGPVLPDPAAPTAGIQPPSADEVIKTLAIARLADPSHAKILVTTALETLDPTSRRQALCAGANSIMLNVTPAAYRRLYTIYPNRAHESESIAAQIEGTIELLRELGRAPTDLSI